MVAENPWVYSFTLYPAEERREFPPILYELMTLYCRVEKVWTEPTFERHRQDLAAVGFTMREIERVPYVLPETVV